MASYIVIRVCVPPFVINDMERDIDGDNSNYPYRTIVHQTVCPKGAFSLSLSLGHRVLGISMTKVEAIKSMNVNQM